MIRRTLVICCLLGLLLPAGLLAAAPAALAPIGAAAARTPTPRPRTPTPRPRTPTPAATSPYTATATLSNLTPKQRTDVTVTGTLHKTAGGAPVVGAKMTATWYYKTTQVSCTAATLTNAKGQASCTRNIGSASVGTPVRVVVRFTSADGKTVYTTAETRFTPKK